jgi:N-acetylglutamate synthase-like GNAT family acetyltransferase
MTKARLEVRNATTADIPEILGLIERAYTELAGYNEGQLRGQLNNFGEGCFVALLDGKLVGYCATFRIGGAKALAPHSWAEITGNGYGSRHNPIGDWLYGYEMCVDP